MSLLGIAQPKKKEEKKEVTNKHQASHQLFTYPTRPIQLLFTDTHSHLLAQPQQTFHHG